MASLACLDAAAEIAGGQLMEQGPRLQRPAQAATVDVEVVHTIGNESAFWIWQTR